MTGNVLSIRAFVPAADFALSLRFYQGLGFRLTQRDDSIAMLKWGGFSFILRRADGTAPPPMMLQMLVRDVDAWWADAQPEALAESLGLPPPSAPAMQDWGMRVGFVQDPSGMIWHIAEALF